MAVAEVFDTGTYEPVYNLRVAEYHTYFVGADGWGFAVWAHNLYIQTGTEAIDRFLPILKGSGKNRWRAANSSPASI